MLDARAFTIGEKEQRSITIRLPCGGDETRLPVQERGDFLRGVRHKRTLAIRADIPAAPIYDRATVHSPRGHQRARPGRSDSGATYNFALDDVDHPPTMATGSRYYSSAIHRRLDSNMSDEHKVEVANNPALSAIYIIGASETGLGLLALLVALVRNGGSPSDPVAVFVFLYLGVVLITLGIGFSPPDSSSTRSTGRSVALAPAYP